MNTRHLLLAACCLLAACANRPSDSPLIHAHRGGAALYPENTLPAMLHAVDLGVPVLEMDMHVTRDSQVVTSHDAYLNPVKALMPDGSGIPPGCDSIYIYSMDYDSLARYDVGSRPNPAFPHRKSLPCRVPRIGELIDSVEHYVARKGLAPVSYNIEIKSSPRKDSICTPDYRTFADLCMQELLIHNLGDRLLVQCFDPRALNYVHGRYPDVRLSYLVEDTVASFGELMSRLDFVPQVISPHYSMVDADFMDEARKLNMEVAPWTVDDPKEAERLTRLGVDAIITNDPPALMK